MILSSDLYITNLIDLDKLQKVQDSLYELTGIAANVYDNGNNIVTKKEPDQKFCEMTRSSQLGNMRCELCDKLGGKTARKDGTAKCYYCHMGLTEVVAPILADGRIIGVFLAGQVRTSDPDYDKIRKCAKEFGVDEEEYIKAYNDLLVMDREKLQKYANSLYVFTNVLSEMAFQKYKQLEANIEIEEANRHKTDFLANMSHEIRTPMNAVLGMAEMALREDMSEDARSYIHQIQASGKNLLTIINDILDYSKIDSGKMEIIEVDYEPLSMINDLTNIIMTRIGDKPIEFIIDVDPSLPGSLHGDNLRIQQVLINLLNNAVKFTEKGEIRLKIECERQTEDTVLLKASVKDTGMGIKKSDMDKLFESFQQLDSKRNRTKEGTGLGLSICRNLLGLMNGELHVESMYNIGSIFSFELPQKITDSNPSIPQLTKKVDAAVLVASPHLNKHIKMDLERIGATVAEATKVRDLEMLRSNYVFVENIYNTDELHHYIESHPDVIFALIVDYESTVKSNIPNIKVLRKPVYALNIATILGMSNIYVKKEDLAQERFDFIAPDVKVLIVDDNEVNLKVAAGLLEPLKMQIDTANGANMAIDLVGKKQYDLILMDHMMPEVDGVETTHIIRRFYKNYENIPIIALTANAMAGTREMFLAEGMNDFIAKPIEMSVMMDKLRQWLPMEKMKIQAKKAVDQQDASDVDIPMVTGLDTKLAMSLLGNEKLFWSVLEEYYDGIERKAKQIQNFFEQGKWKEYTIDVHALKSASKQIGAVALSKMAEQLEEAGNSNDVAYIKEHTATMLKKYLEYLPILKEHFEKTSDSESSVSTQVNGLDGEVGEMLTKMQEAIDSFDILEIDGMFRELKRMVIPANQKMYLDNLEDAVAEEDIDACQDALDLWKDNL